MNVLSLFDGISCGHVALDKCGLEVHNYYASEIDRFAMYVTDSNYPHTIQLGDVRYMQVFLNQLPKIDLMIGGSPCQGFSNARGLVSESDPRNMLAYEFANILHKVKPAHFLFENVVMDKENRDKITRALGVEPVLINSDRFVPQNRPRLYWTNIPIAQLPERPEWNFKYWQYRRNHWRENKSGVCPCLTANMGTGGNNVPYVEDNGIRRVLSCEDLETLQGLPKGYARAVSDSRRKQAIGNGWTVDVIAHILNGLKVVR